MPVRPLCATDAPSLQQHCFPDLPLYEVEDYVGLWMHEQAWDGLTCLVAEIEGRVVGSVRLVPYFGIGEIGSLVVGPSYRRQGIGTALMRAVIELARQRGLHKLELSANVTSPWIRAWYERLGFKYQRDHVFPRDERVAVLTMDLQGDAMIRAPRLTIDVEGYYLQDGERLIPVGVNYWPASCGVEMWQEWPSHEIQHDLDVLVDLGLNAVRFFLRWQDFEPQPGAYDILRAGRLSQFLGWCADRGLYAQPSLFVGWMSGGTFWPEWKAGRNLFADPYMIERSVAFAQRVAAIIAAFDGHLLGIDQGNEICCLSDSSAAPPQAVIDWCAAINDAIRSVYPQALIISGNEQNQVLNDTGWRFGQQPGTDLYSMHGYPVPAWHSIGFDGMTDPLCQSLLPFYTQIARAFGPVLVQEFGTIVTFGAEQQESYLRALLPACWQAGANGFLWWCLRDVVADVHPYVKHRFESTLGLVDSEDRVKPGLEFYVEFARSLQQRPLPARTVAPADKTIGLYWPKHHYPRDNPLNPGNNPRQLSRWLVIANFLLRQLGYQTQIVRGDLPLPASLDTLLIPGTIPDALEVQAIEAWVQSGGHLIWHGPDPANWGHEYVRLLGARPVDYRAARPVQIEAFGHRWTLGVHPKDMRVEVVPDTATVVARDQDAHPVLLALGYGAGRVVSALPVVEASMAEMADDHRARARWIKWYEGMLEP